jgi:hypothetical protein
VIEKKGVIAAFRRSRELAAGPAGRSSAHPRRRAHRPDRRLHPCGIAEAIAGRAFLPPGGPLLRIVFDILVTTVIGPPIGLVAAVLY